MQIISIAYLLLFCQLCLANGKNDGKDGKDGGKNGTNEGKDGKDVSQANQPVPPNGQNVAPTAKVPHTLDLSNINKDLFDSSNATIDESPALIIAPGKGTNLMSIVQDGKKVWEAPAGETCTLCIAYLKGTTPMLLHIMTETQCNVKDIYYKYKEKNDCCSCYSKKKKKGWHVSQKKYYEKITALRTSTGDVTEINMDVGNTKTNGHCIAFVKDVAGVSTVLQTPESGYHVTHVFCGKKELFKYTASCTCNSCRGSCTCCGCCCCSCCGSNSCCKGGSSCSSCCGGGSECCSSSSSCCSSNCCSGGSCCSSSCCGCSSVGWLCRWDWLAKCFSWCCCSGKKKRRVVLAITHFDGRTPISLHLILKNNSGEIEHQYFRNTNLQWLDCTSNQYRNTLTALRGESTTCVAT